MFPIQLRNALLATIGIALLCSANAVSLHAGQMAVAAVQTQVESHSGLSAGVKALLKNSLLPLTTNTVFVAETTKQNASKTSLADIQKTDKAWIGAEEPLPVQMEKLGNATAKELKRLQKEYPAIVEVFVMDNQGALVGASNLTSDYWQGDEAKWKNSFKDGAGGIDVSEPEFDKSANTVIQQVSLPILDAKSNVIGAITFGLNVSAL